MPESRQLAAIMFTDIVGYTVLMGKDETAAYQLLKKNRQIQKSIIEKHRGKWLKEIGDGNLASFQTITDAVYCAIEIQRRCSEEPDLKLRIGIHQGEVIVEDGDVFGDGVNIASRLEPLAPEGGIYVSESVFRNIQNKKGVSAVYVGEKKLKNVDHPVRIYEINVEASETIVPDTPAIEPAPEIKARATGWIKPIYITPFIVIVVVVAYFIYHNLGKGTNSAKVSEQETAEKSIAVLPFVNMSDDPDQEYFCDGMMEEILMHLYKIGDIEVVSRTSVLQYKGTTKTIPQIADELGVIHILEGSVRKSGERVRISVQLIDAVKDKQIWAETYEREMNDVFSIQSDVAQQVAQSLDAEITTEVRRRIESIPTDNLEAYTLYLRARYNPDGYVRLNETPRILLEQAINLDPNFAEAYSELGWYWLVNGNFLGTLSQEEVLEKALPMLEKALELKPDLAEIHIHLACTYLWFQWDFESAEKEYDLFLQLNPSNVERGSMYVDFLLASGRFAEAKNFAERIVRIDSSFFQIVAYYLSYCFNNESDKAIARLESTDLISPDYRTELPELGRICVYAGRFDLAVKIIENSDEIHDFRYPRLLGILGIGYYKTGEIDKAIDILNELKIKSAETTVGSPAYYTALILAQMGEIDNAFDWLEKAYLGHEVEMFWLKVEPPFEPLRSDPRYQEMLDKVGFSD